MVVMVFGGNHLFPQLQCFVPTSPVLRKRSLETLSNPPMPNFGTRDRFLKNMYLWKCGEHISACSATLVAILPCLHDRGTHVWVPHWSCG